jgi:hypothetical protein
MSPAHTLTEWQREAHCFSLRRVFHRLFFLYRSNGHSRDSLLVHPFLLQEFFGYGGKEEQMTETIDDRER